MYPIYLTYPIHAIHLIHPIYPIYPVHPIYPMYPNIPHIPCMPNTPHMPCIHDTPDIPLLPDKMCPTKKAHQVDDQLIMWMTSSCAHASIKNSVVMARRLSWKLLIRWRCISIPYLGALGDSTTLGQIKGGSYEGGNLMYAYIIYMSSSYYTASLILLSNTICV